MNFSILRKLNLKSISNQLLLLIVIKADPFDLKEKMKFILIFLLNQKLYLQFLLELHWNNYEIGSVFQVRRYPDIFIREMSSYLNFLSII